MPPRTEILRQVASIVCSYRLSHPFRVGIDGIDAAGKTTFADELYSHIENNGRPVIRASVDHFHRPRIERYRRGELSSEGYYHDSFDYSSIRSCLLEPLGPDGSLAHKTASFDYRSDSAVEQQIQIAPTDATLLFDGIFLFRPELDDCWDFRIWLQVDPAIALRRALVRDAASAPDVETRYRRRYQPAQEMYIRQCNPERRADLVVDNNDPSGPILYLRSAAPLTY